MTAIDTQERGESFCSRIRRLRVIQRLSSLLLQPWALALLCLLTLCATVGAGLKPFHVPLNDVSWDQNAIHFGRYGTALSDGEWKFSTVDDVVSIELWVRPAKVWARGCIVSFYNPQRRQLFRIDQDYTKLVLRLGEQNTDEVSETLPVPNVFRGNEVFITVTFDGRQTHVYIDGQLYQSSSVFRLPSRNLSGQLILGNAPLRNQNWSGEIKGLAIYEDQLNSTQVLRQYQNWKEQRGPGLETAWHLAALYQFKDEGHIVHSSVPSGIALNLPKRFLVVDHLLFESPLSEFYSEDSYFKNAVMNVAGFIPLGFTVGLYLVEVLRMRKAGLLTVLIGAVVSLAIEFFQWLLPTRYSGCTDIVTNTIGTWIGFHLCKCLFRRVRRT